MIWGEEGRGKGKGFDGVATILDFGNRLHSLEPFRLCVRSQNTRSHSWSIDLLNGWQARQRRLAYVNQLPSWNSHKNDVSISGSNGITFDVSIRAGWCDGVLKYLNWIAGVYEKTFMRRSHCQIIQFCQ